MMRAVAVLALLALGEPAWAESQDVCRTAEAQVGTAFPLPHAAQALANKRLSVLVVGAGSSALPGPDGVRKAYPARLQAALAATMPEGIAVTVATDVEPRRSAEQMVRVLAPALANTKPELVIWQTGTVDAVRGVDPDQFSQVLEQGIAMSRTAGADLILVNAQYSPRTESMIALGAYADLMRRVAAQQEVPLFDRFSVMKTWADLGIFDFYAPTKKLDTAEHVHNCMGRLLADLVLESVKLGGPQSDSGR
jgi:GDSL-like lipase/acylhydrolase family protein